MSGKRGMYSEVRYANPTRMATNLKFRNQDSDSEQIVSQPNAVVPRIAFLLYNSNSISIDPI